MAVVPIVAESAKEACTSLLRSSTEGLKKKIAAITSSQSDTMFGLLRLFCIDFKEHQVAAPRRLKKKEEKDKALVNTG